MRIRKNIKLLTSQEINDLKKAYQLLQQETTNGYETISGIHGLPSPISCPHHTADLAFLPWHRQYLLNFENLLRKFVPTVTLPYFDWSQTPLPNTPDGLPEICQPSVVNMNDTNPLSTAPIRWVPPFIERFRDRLTPDQIAFLGQGWSIRAAAARELMHDPQGANLRQLTLDAFTAKTIENFSSFIEQPHDNFHGHIGHHMGTVEMSAFDPIFWIHHAAIDKFWALWQHLNPGAIQHPHPNATMTDLGNITFGSVLKTTDLDYDYDEIVDLKQRPAFRELTITEKFEKLNLGQRPKDFILIKNLEMPMTNSVFLRFFIGEEKPTKDTPTVGNPNFLGSIFLFGMKGISHSHGQMIPFSRRILLNTDLEDLDKLRIVAVDMDGRELNPKTFITEKPKLIKQQ